MPQWENDRAHSQVTGYDSENEGCNPNNAQLASEIASVSDTLTTAIETVVTAEGQTNSGRLTEVAAVLIRIKDYIIPLFQGQAVPGLPSMTMGQLSESFDGIIDHAKKFNWEQDGHWKELHDALVAYQNLLCLSATDLQDKYLT